MTRSLILGTAGHIDHGKTELVKALTGVDTDRLKEEKERGITIDLGFAELRGEGGGVEVQLGIVDVPGHEGFIRNMLAGATGMDVVLLVVASDEGVMPQTREHLAILRLLGVRRVVVALTKADLVEEEWLELVREEVAELLEAAGLGHAPLVPTSTRTGRGLAELTRALLDAASAVEEEDENDVVRLPVDRAFTVRGTGTVVTGTLWSGRLRTGRKVRLLPDGVEARVRGLQVHGRDVEAADAGQRTAVALTGAGVDLDSVRREQTLVDVDAWQPASMLTVRLELLPDAGWSLEPGQRVRVHLGTAEVMARAVLLDRDAPLAPGEAAWVQLRLERPAVARARERIVVRSYSPMTTIGGATVAEAPASKRTRVEGEEVARLEAILRGEPLEAVEAVVASGGWAGAARDALPLATGLAPARTASAAAEVVARGGLDLQGRLVSPALVEEAERRLLAAVDAHHEAEPLRPGVALDALRGELPPGAAPGLADALLASLADRGVLRLEGGSAARADFRPRLTDEQAEARERLLALYREADVAPPSLGELPPELRDRGDLWPLLRLAEAEGALTLLEDDLFVDAAALARAGGRVQEVLGGRTGLGPADFREVLPVTRRHLLPLLAWFDRAGVTVRRGDAREVPPPVEGA